MIQIAASAYSPIVRVLLSEDPQQKVALFARLEGTGKDDVAPRVQVKPLQDFTGIGKGARRTSTVVVVYPMFREYITAIIWGLGKENGRMWNGRMWNGRMWNGRVWNGRMWNGK